jgi:AcrR family transcriptional regulator
VLEALLALVDEGELRPTAQQVASRAGVALRTVYHHFEDVEALRGMALELQLARHREELRPVKTDLELDERIAIVARQCRRLFEAITPIRRATLFDETASLETADGLRQNRGVRRAHIERTFAPELSGQRDGGRSLLDAADVSSSWQTWYYLRQALGRSAAAAERVMIMELQSLLHSAAA